MGHTYPWLNLGDEYRGRGVVAGAGLGVGGGSRGIAAGSWYSVVSAHSSSFWSTLCALDADLMSMNETVAHAPPGPGPDSAPRDTTLTLCTRPYLWTEKKIRRQVSPVLGWKVIGTLVHK